MNCPIRKIIMKWLMADNAVAFQLLIGIFENFGQPVEKLGSRNAGHYPPVENNDKGHCFSNAKLSFDYTRPILCPPVRYRQRPQHISHKEIDTVSRR
jgi:hypothetical protein